MNLQCSRPLIRNSIIAKGMSEALCANLVAPSFTLSDDNSIQGTHSHCVTYLSPEKDKEDNA